MLQAWLPMVSLALVSLLAGVAMLWVFGRVSNQQAIERTRKRLNAALYELRLFADEPSLIFRAQKELLLGNLRYLGLMLRPSVVIAIPMVLLLAQLEVFYGHRPLPLGEPALVTVQLKAGVDPSAPAPVLEVPHGIALETPAVRALADRQVSWRIRPERPVSGNLRIAFPAVTLEKSVVAGSGIRRVSSRRVSSATDWILCAGESRLPAGPADWIAVSYPPAEVRFWGFGLHWLVWFLILSLTSAWFLRKRFGVAI